MLVLIWVCVFPQIAETCGVLTSDAVIHIEGTAGCYGACSLGCWRGCCLGAAACDLFVVLLVTAQVHFFARLKVGASGHADWGASPGAV